MSLNGLDDKPVKEAHQNALAEAGGWYVSMISIASRGLDRELEK